jgi:hypothetical protein
MIAHEKGEHIPFLVSHYVKQVQAADVSQRRTAVSSNVFNYTYYTCSDRLLTIALPLALSVFFPHLL